MTEKLHRVKKPYDHLTIKEILRSPYSDSQAQYLLNKFHKDVPDNMISYRVFDDEKDNGGKIVRIVRRIMK